MTQPPMGQQSYFYYHPEHTSNHRNQGHFTPQPTSMPMDYFTYPLSHSRPQSARPDMLYHSTPHYISQAMLTPTASPQPMQQKPTILVQQERPFYMHLDTSYMPATPTLSATSSSSFSSQSLDSPLGCGMMPTPIELDYRGNTAFDGFKRGCEEEVFSEILSAEWTGTNSPPLTPGKHES